MAEGFAVEDSPKRGEWGLPNKRAGILHVQERGVTAYWGDSARVKL
jgi:hypothetical protein